MKAAVKEDGPKPAEFTLPDAIDLNVGYGPSKLTFKFKMLTLEEERQWANADAAKLDKKHDPEAEYRLMAEKLARVSLAPIMAPNEDGDPVQVFEDLDAAASIRELFKVYSAALERLCVQVYIEYRQAMVPTKGF
jgi:hypothetical protein